jgi:hypothetical protein
MANIILTRANQGKWLHNGLVFLAPLGVLYLTTIIGVVSQDNHTVSLNDFIPNKTAQGGLILWVLNAALDYLRKLRA